MKRSEKKKLEREYESVVMRKAEEFNANGKLTVAVFSDAFFPCVDGVVMVVHNVGERLLGDCNYVVFAPRHKGLTVQKNYLVVGCRSGYVKELNYDVASFFNLGRLFRRTVKRLRIDVIHAHSPFMLGIAALRLHKKTGAPFVMTFHSQYKQDIYKATHSRLLTRIGLGFVMKSFNGADEVWTMHEASAATLKSYGYKGKIRFMPNATDFVYPDDADERKAIVRKKYGVIGDDKLFLFVGRLVTQKNILFIVEVLRRLKERGLVFRMLYVGDGPDKKKLENKIIEEGVEKECVLVGRISDKDLIKDYYLAADMVLFPSKYDVSSLIQIEAAAMKTPCAFMEGSVTSCTITGGVDGLILPDDADGFAEGVYDLVTDGEKLENMSEMAYKNVYVTWERVSSLALERYKRLAEKSRDVKQAEDE